MRSRLDNLDIHLDTLEIWTQYGCRKLHMGVLRIPNTLSAPMAGLVLMKKHT